MLLPTVPVTRVFLSFPTCASVVNERHHSMVRVEALERRKSQALSGLLPNVGGPPKFETCGY